MNNQVATTDNALQQVPVELANEDVSCCVESQEKLERIIPQAAYLIIAGIFMIYALANWNRDALAVVIYGIFTFFMANLVVRGIRGLVLESSRRIRYDRAADNLRSRLQRGVTSQSDRSAGRLARLEQWP